MRHFWMGLATFRLSFIVLFFGFRWFQWSIKLAGASWNLSPCWRIDVDFEWNHPLSHCLAESWWELKHGDRWNPKYVGLRSPSRHFVVGHCRSLPRPCRSSRSVHRLDELFGRMVRCRSSARDFAGNSAETLEEACSRNHWLSIRIIP